MTLPPPRGELTGWLVTALRDGRAGAVPEPAPAGCPPWLDDDLQLALWCCYELRYRGFADVPAEREWSAEVLAFRAGLERRWLAGLRSLTRDRLGTAPSRPTAGMPTGGTPAEGVPAALRRLVDGWAGPDLSGFLLRRADRARFAEFVAHRSIYQLKEADPHSLGIPRLDGPVKAALVEILADEYGGGRPERMHAELFRGTMRWFGLDTAYGRYVPRAPAVTLALSNVMSFFGLHGEWIGALLGHLAALEMTSTGPNRRYSGGARRLGAGPDARHYFDEHVEADAVHEQLAAYDLCGGFARSRPDAAGDVLFGAACCLALEDAFAEHLLTSWAAGRSSLRAPAAAGRPVRLPAPGIVPAAR
jgi:hypothetical protein